MNRRLHASIALAGLLLAAVAAPATAQSPAPEGGDDGRSARLADHFPTTLGGQPLEVTIDDGAGWLARFDESDADGATVIERTRSLLESVGASVEDLSIATAQHAPSEGNVATISAIRVRGAGAHDLIGGGIELLLGDVATPDLEMRIDGGRDVLKVRDAEMPGAYPRTLVATGDTLWIIEAEPPVLGEILAALPPDREPAPPAFDLAASVPRELAGDRRVYLVVSSGWDYVYWLSENYPSELETVALQSYLASGIPIDDVTTTSAVWTDDAGDIGAVLAAYQFAGADQATLEELLETVILPGFEGLGSEHEEIEVAGRTVTRLIDESLVGPEGDVRPITLYISGDTVFVLDADEEIIADAIASLP